VESLKRRFFPWFDWNSLNEESLELLPNRAWTEKNKINISKKNPFSFGFYFEIC